MTLIADTNSPGPQTHALILGVGNYPHINDPAWKKLESHDIPINSARQIVDWLLHKYKNPFAPLGSVEVLAEGITPFILDNIKVGRVDSPSFDKSAQTIRDWYERTSADEENLAVFYFCGLGIHSRRRILLALPEWGKENGPALADVIDLTHVIDGMASRRASRQLYLIDLYTPDLPFPIDSIESFSAPLIMDAEAPATPPPLTTIIVNGSVDPNDFAADNGASIFTRALIHALDEPLLGDGAIDSQSLFGRLDKRLSELSPPNSRRLRPTATILGAFDFHYPNDSNSSTFSDGLTVTKNEASENVNPVRSEAEIIGIDDAYAESNTEFMDDDAEVDHDELGRDVLAIALGRRLHRIWCSLNNAIPVPAPAQPKNAVQIIRCNSADWTGRAEKRRAGR